MSAIYVQKGDKRAGPFTESELEQLVENGEFSGGDTFWVEGMDEWLPLSTVIEMVPMEEPAATPVMSESSPPEAVPPVLPGEPPAAEAGKAAVAKAPELAPPPLEPPPVEPPPPSVLRPEPGAPAQAPAAPPAAEAAAPPIPPPPLPQEAPPAKVEVAPPEPPPTAADSKAALESPLPAPPLIASKEGAAPAVQTPPPATTAPAPTPGLAPSEKGILFERDGVLVTREDLEIDGETYPISSIERTETHVEHVRRFGSVFGSIVLGVVIICVALVPFPRINLTHWMIWGIILGALVIWWSRCLYSALRSARSHVDIIFRDGTERVVSTNPGDAKKLSAAIDDALVVPQPA